MTATPDLDGLAYDQLIELMAQVQTQMAAREQARQAEAAALRDPGEIAAEIATIETTCLGLDTDPATQALAQSTIRLLRITTDQG